MGALRCAQAHWVLVEEEPSSRESQVAAVCWGGSIFIANKTCSSGRAVKTSLKSPYKAHAQPTGQVTAKWDGVRKARSTGDKSAKWQVKWPTKWLVPFCYKWQIKAKQLIEIILLFSISSSSRTYFSVLHVTLHLSTWVKKQDDKHEYF